MKKNLKALIGLTITAASLPSCSDHSIPDVPEPSAPTEEMPSVGWEDEYHQKIRTVPYPRSCNEIYINPAPLIVPQGMVTGEYVEIELSDDPTFASGHVSRSKAQKWLMYNVHEILHSGSWYWRFRSVDADGNSGEWGETYDFEVSDDVERFVTPDYQTFKSHLPNSYPRLHCYTAATVGAARENIEEHNEYKALIGRAATPLKTDFNDIRKHYRQAQALLQSTNYLYQAFYLTQQPEYAEKLLEIIKAMAASQPTEQELYSDNFTTSSLVATVAACYDILYLRLDASTRQWAESWLASAIERNFDSFRGYEENHIFDNHFWQQNYRNFFQACLVIHDNPEQESRVAPMLEYLYELWTSRAPAGGFNRDGLWHNGAGYFNANIQTLCYVPLMLSYITGFDFLQHPWYRNAGKAMSFTCPPGGSNVGFGDASESRQTPNHQMASMADFLAYQTGDPYAEWYALQCGKLVESDYEMRIYRVCRGPQSYNNLPEGGIDMLHWNKDCGEVAMHSSLSSRSVDVGLGFRSSTFGSGSHTTASQNAFNITFGGEDVFRSSGYYQNFSDAHNLMSYRHTRAHNTILVNGIGQPYSTEGWGRILRAASGESMAYALGDASHAYCGISNDEMWVKAFADAGIAQIPANGFGPTPLTLYHRHVVMLRSGQIVIYDELEASENAQFDWLLHSRVEFEISEDGSVAETADENRNYRARLTLLGSGPVTMKQTDEWVAAPTVQGDAYPAQWHLTASAPRGTRVRYLAIIETGRYGSSLSKIEKNADGSVRIGDWTVKVSLDPTEPSYLEISDSKGERVLSFGDDDVEAGGTVYHRNYYRSTMLVDRVNGSITCQELTDTKPQSTRSF
ncbi:MAG: DUF4962 domain-containing protein [Muribaculaceae bacterium]|nr:DUF4962 domain-containing protein [Muribaculaceae bacterium]